MKKLLIPLVLLFSFSIAQAQNFTITCDKEVYYCLRDCEAVCNFSSYAGSQTANISATFFNKGVEPLRISELTNVSYTETVLDWGNVTHWVTCDLLEDLGDSLNCTIGANSTLVWKNDLEGYDLSNNTYWFKSWEVVGSHEVEKWKYEWKALDFTIEKSYPSINTSINLSKVTIKFEFQVPIGSKGKFSVRVWNENGSYELDPWWDSSWKYRRGIKVKAGIRDRTFEAIRVNLTIPLDHISNCWKEIRVTQCSNSQCSVEEEVPVEVLEGDNSTYCLIEWVGNLTKGEWRYYWVYYGNPYAEAPDYGDYPKYYFFPVPNPFENLTGVDLGEVFILERNYSQAFGGYTATWPNTFPPNVTKWDGEKWEVVEVYGYEGNALTGGDMWNLTHGFACGDHQAGGLVDDIFKWNPDLERWERYYRPPHADTLHDVECVENFCVVAGSWEYIYWWDGEAWHYQDLEGWGWHFLGADVYNSTLAWAVGNWGSRWRIATWNGNTWTWKELGDYGGAPQAISCLNESFCFIVGSYGKIVEYRKNSWEVIQAPTNNHLTGVKIVGDKEAWAFGRYGTMLKWNGKEWKLAKSPLNVSYGGYFFAHFGNPVDFKNNFGVAVGSEIVSLEAKEYYPRILLRDPPAYEILAEESFVPPPTPIYKTLIVGIGSIVLAFGGIKFMLRLLGSPKNPEDITEVFTGIMIILALIALCISLASSLL